MPKNTSLLPTVILKKGEDKRLRQGHVWVYSNEIDTEKTPLDQFFPGEEVVIETANQISLGSAYINPHSLISARLFDRKANSRLNSSLIANRIQEALRLREQLFSHPHYRLVFSESDQLPGLVIDRYGNDLVAQVNTAGMEKQKDVIILALQEVFPALNSLLWRNDNRTRQQEGLENYIAAALGKPPEVTRIEENMTSFYVPLWKGQKTGWFFDHRLNRARLKNYVHGQTILDVFCYLGGWGIQAATQGAKSVTCIDSSAFACEWTLKNASLNGVQDKVEVICEEAIISLQKLYQQKSKFDIIILDPPAYIKRRKDKKAGLRAYERLHSLAMRLLNPYGILVAGSCSMHLSNEDLDHVLRKASMQARCPLQILERGHQGPDHPIHLFIPETDYLKAVFLRRLA